MAISFIRICGALMIFLCHVFGESGSSIGGALCQVFNVGVVIFFMLTGYLYSTKKPIDSVPKWYWRRMKRILCPLYVFLAMLMAVYIILGQKIDIAVWLQSIIPICGFTQKYISGCGHLWFITHLMVCYLLVPPLQRHRDNVSVIKIIGGTAFWSMSAILLAYTVPPIWCTLLNSVANFLLGFYLLPAVLKKEHHVVIPILFAMGACGLRVVFKLALDDTPLYNSVLTEVCSAVLAIAIFDLLFKIGTYIKSRGVAAEEKAINTLANFTYEFYLVHYIFLNGNFKVHIFESYLLNSVAAFIFAAAAAFAVHFLSELIQRKNKPKTYSAYEQNN